MKNYFYAGIYNDQKWFSASSELKGIRMEKSTELDQLLELVIPKKEFRESSEAVMYTKEKKLVFYSPVKVNGKENVVLVTQVQESERAINFIDYKPGWIKANADWQPETMNSYILQEWVPAKFDVNEFLGLRIQRRAVCKILDALISEGPKRERPIIIFAKSIDTVKRNLQIALNLLPESLANSISFHGNLTEPSADKAKSFDIVCCGSNVAEKLSDGLGIKINCDDPGKLISVAANYWKSNTKITVAQIQNAIRENVDTFSDCKKLERKCGIDYFRWLCEFFVNDHNTLEVLERIRKLYIGFSEDIKWDREIRKSLASVSFLLFGPLFFKCSEDQRTFLFPVLRDYSGDKWISFSSILNGRSRIEVLDYVERMENEKEHFPDYVREEWNRFYYGYFKWPLEIKAVLIDHIKGLPKEKLVEYICNGEFDDCTKEQIKPLFDSIQTKFTTFAEQAKFLCDRQMVTKEGLSNLIPFIFSSEHITFGEMQVWLDTAKCFKTKNANFFAVLKNLARGYIDLIRDKFCADGSLAELYRDYGFNLLLIDKIVVIFELKDLDKKKIAKKIKRIKNAQRDYSRCDKCFSEEGYSFQAKQKFNSYQPEKYDEVEKRVRWPHRGFSFSLSLFIATLLVFVSQITGCIDWNLLRLLYPAYEVLITLVQFAPIALVLIVHPLFCLAERKKEAKRVAKRAFLCVFFITVLPYVALMIYATVLYGIF